jgi:ribosomal protein S6
MYIDSPYPAVAELERVMGYSEDIIRKAIFKIDSIPTESSELMVSVNAKDGSKNK